MQSREKPSKIIIITGHQHVTMPQNQPKIHSIFSHKKLAKKTFNQLTLPPSSLTFYIMDTHNIHSNGLAGKNY